MRLALPLAASLMLPFVAMAQPSLAPASPTTPPAAAEPAPTPEAAAATHRAQRRIDHHTAHRTARLHRQATTDPQ